MLKTFAFDHKAASKPFLKKVSMKNDWSKRFEILALLSRKLVSILSLKNLQKNNTILKSLQH